MWEWHQTAQTKHQGPLSHPNSPNQNSCCFHSLHSLCRNMPLMLKYRTQYMGMNRVLGIWFILTRPTKQQTFPVYISNSTAWQNGIWHLGLNSCVQSTPNMDINFSIRHFKCKFYVIRAVFNFNTHCRTVFFPFRQKWCTLNRTLPHSSFQYQMGRITVIKFCTS